MMQTNLNFLLEPFCYNNSIFIEEDDINIDNLDEYQNSDSNDENTAKSSFYNYSKTTDSQNNGSIISKENKDDFILTDDIFKDFVRNIPKKILTPEETKMYFERIKNNNDIEAKNYIIEHNQKLIISIAKRYVGNGLSIMDLIIEGNFGLIKAIEKYDIEKGYHFSTYATWSIRQAIQRSIANTGKSIRIPVYAGEKIAKIEKVKQNYENNLGREPTMDEIAKELKTSKKNIESLMQTTQNVISYDMSISDEDDSDELQDFIADDSNEIEEMYLKKDLSEIIQKSLEILTPREKYIITERFGLNDGVPKTLESISKNLNITRERVRQIESIILKRLRKNSNIQKTKNYLDNPENISSEIDKNSLGKVLSVAKTTILEAIKYLEPHEQDILQEVFGKDYNNYTKDELDGKTIKVIDKLKLFISALKDPSKVNVIKDNLYNFLNISSSYELNYLINNLDKEEKLILDRKYLNGYENIPVEDLTLPIENYFSKKVVPSLRKIKTNYERKYMKTKKDNFLIAKDSLQKAYLYLSKDEKDFIEKNFVMRNKELYLLEELKSYSHDATYQKLLEYAINIENTGRYDFNIYEIPFISLTNARSTAELEFFLTNLSKDDKALLKERFGNDYLHKMEIGNISYNKNKKIKSKIIPNINDRILNFTSPLELTLGVSKETVKKAISYFDPLTQQKIKALYHYHKNNNIELTLDDYVSFKYRIIPVLTTAINELETINSLSEKTKENIKHIEVISKKDKKPRFNTTDKHLKEIVASFSKKEQKVFLKNYNTLEKTSLTTKEKELSAKVAQKISYYLQLEKKLAKRNPLIEVIYEDKKVIEKALEYFNKEDQTLLKEKFHLIRSNKNLNNLEEEAIYRLQHVLVPLFKKSINSFKENGYITSNILKEIEEVSSKTVEAKEKEFRKLKKALSYYTPEDRELITKRFNYTEKLLNAKELTEKEIIHLQKIVSIYLEALTYLDNHKNLNEELINKIRYNTWKNNHEFTNKEKILNIVRTLPKEEKKLFLKKFSTDLEKVYPHRLTEEERILYKEILIKIKDLKSKNVSSLIEELNENDEVILQALNYFSKKDKSLLKAKFNLTKRYNLITNLDEASQDKFFTQTVPLFKEILNYLNNNIKIPEELLKKLSEISSQDISEKQLQRNQKEILNYFNKKDRALLIDKLNLQNIRKNNSISLNSTEEHLQDIIEYFNKALTFLNQNKFISSELIEDIKKIFPTNNTKYSLDNEFLLKIVSTLSTDEQNIFYKKFGPNLDGVGSIKLNSWENESYKDISKKISTIIFNEKKKKTLKARFKVPKECVLDIVKDLSLEEQKLFFQKFDENLNIRKDFIIEKELQEQLGLLSKKISRKILAKEKKKTTKKALRFKADKSTLLKIINTLNNEEKNVFLKRNGDNLDDIDDSRLTPKEKDLYNKVCAKISARLIKQRKIKDILEKEDTDEVSVPNNVVLTSKDWFNIRSIYESLDEEQSQLLGINNTNLLEKVLFSKDKIQLTISEQKELYTALRVLFIISKDVPKISKNKTYMKSITNYLQNNN